MCLDNVEGLGKFIEVEKMINQENEKETQKNLIDFIKSLGIDEQDIITKGYDTLIYEKINLS